MMFLLRALALLWFPISVVLTAAALAHLFNLISPDTAQWAAIVKGPLELYGQSMAGLFKPVQDLAMQQASFALPAWSGDAAVAYASSASACMLAGTTLAKRQGFVDGARSSAASLGWPLAIVLFVFNSIRNRVVSRFAAEHTLLFLLYVLAVAGVLGAALYADRWIGSAASSAGA